ncbi:phage protein [Yersinia pseudotuberculosis]|uniref:hypothetical protein n=1 Tax=Yersinia pseudotuberculosis TaxID=633 RepID=UPI000F71B895|nr:hypothetical protein [Yersinia pseudotuberculosis]VEB12135.1 phage protein [Yersinia pseudotuberculosis]
MITDKDVVPALASVGFNRYTTFGWVLPRPSLGGWQDSGSFSTHANVEMKKPRRLTEASNSSLPLQRMQLPPLVMNLVHFSGKCKTLFL